MCEFLFVFVGSTITEGGGEGMGEDGGEGMAAGGGRWGGRNGGNGGNGVQRLFNLLYDNF